MELIAIKISNYKSIEEVEIPVNRINDGSYTFGLIGVNESGKSSVLTAISLIDNFEENKPSISDFKDKNLPIEVRLSYKISKRDYAELDLENDEKNINYTFKLYSNNIKAPSYYLEGESNTPEKTKFEYVSNSLQYKNFDKLRHKTILWKHDPKYLIEKEVVFQPKQAQQIINSNIPLKNCFKLSRIDLVEFSNNITDSLERDVYQEKLSNDVSEFVEKLWPNEKLSIKLKFR